MKTIISKAAKINGRLDHLVVQACLDSCDRAETKESEKRLMTEIKLEGQLNTRHPETQGQSHTETFRRRGFGQAERPETLNGVRAEVRDFRSLFQIENPDTRDPGSRDPDTRDPDSRYSSHPDKRGAGYTEEPDPLQQVSTDSPRDLMKHPKLRLFTFVMIFAWLVLNIISTLSAYFRETVYRVSLVQKSGFRWCSMQKSRKQGFAVTTCRLGVGRWASVLECVSY